MPLRAPERLDRRQFLRAAAAAVACAPLASCGPAPGSARALRSHEARTLAAVCDRLVPPDATFPGAVDSGVIRFIDQQLQGRSRTSLGLYRRGLEALDEASLQLYSRPFANLDGDSQDRLLSLVEKGDVPGEGWRSVQPREFFAKILDQTMQGYYGDPRHGGNLNAVSWRMLGIPHPPLRGRDRYEP